MQTRFYFSCLGILVGLGPYFLYVEKVVELAVFPLRFLDVLRCNRNLGISLAA